MSYTRSEWRLRHQQGVGFHVSTGGGINKPKRKKSKHRLKFTRLPTIEEIADPDFLLSVFDELKFHAGQAPGLDRIKYSDLGRMEAPLLMRFASKAILSGQYMHGPTRHVDILKKDGSARGLEVPNLIDRVISAATNKSMRGFSESIFIPRSLGFRPDKSCWHFLGGLEAEMIATDRWVLAIDDVRKAFNNVVIQYVMDVLRGYIEDPSVLTLIQVVLQGQEGTSRLVGIDQGSAFSPTALNFLMHHAHDLWAEIGNLLWWRYADNLVYICQNMYEGETLLRSVDAQLQRFGLNLKGEDGPPKDLSQGETAQLLGYTISRGKGGLRFEPGTEAFTKLDQMLGRVHGSPNPSISVQQTVIGWFDYMGPAFECDRESVLGQVIQLAAKHGFREINPDKVLKQWAGSWERWMRLRMQAQKSTHVKDCPSPVSGDGYRAPPSMWTAEMPSTAEDCGVMDRCPVGNSPESASPGSEREARVSWPPISPVHIQVLPPDSPIFLEVQCGGQSLRKETDDEPERKIERVGEDAASGTDELGIRIAPRTRFSVGGDRRGESAADRRTAVALLGGQSGQSGRPHVNSVGCHRPRSRDPPLLDGVRIVISPSSTT